MVRSGQPLSYFPFVEGERIAKATVVVHAMRWKWHPRPLLTPSSFYNAIMMIMFELIRSSLMTLKNVVQALVASTHIFAASGACCEERSTARGDWGCRDSEGWNHRTGCQAHVDLWIQTSFPETSWKTRPGNARLSAETTAAKAAPQCSLPSISLVVSIGSVRA